ncbi:MAG TPA: cation diffusion facilitator family transporter [Herpetosiphonaceae bacterium]
MGAALLQSPSKTFYAALSIGAALLTIALKFTAYAVTDSVGLLSDATESVVNLLAALVALWALVVAARPPDDDHAFGHSKAEYFSSGFEGALIVLAALSIALAAWPRLLNPQPIEEVGLGLALSLAASAVNGVVAWVLLRAGRRLRSITLEADARHLLTDVWTTGGVLLGIGLVQLTGWLVLDPLIAFLVAAQIIWAGVRLIRDTGYGLLDQVLPAEDRAAISAVLAVHEKEGIVFHAIRTRAAGPRRFVSLHVLVPGHWSVTSGHALCDEIELAISAALPECHVMTHLEPLEDPIAWQDQELDRIREHG